MDKNASKQNIQLVKSLLEGTLEIHRIGEYDQIFEKAVRIHGPFNDHDGNYDISLGKAFDTWLAKNFIKRIMDIQEIFAHEDKVIAYWILHCKCRKNDKNVSISGTSMYRVVNGKICEIWQSLDTSVLSEVIGDDRDFASFPALLEKLSKQDPARMLGFEKYRAQASELSKRERDCIRHLLLGKTSKETACSLKLSVRTIEYYYENLKLKLDCDTKRDLFAKAQLMAKLKLL